MRTYEDRQTERGKGGGSKLDGFSLLSELPESNELLSLFIVNLPVGDSINFAREFIRSEWSAKSVQFLKRIFLSRDQRDFPVVS